MAGGSGGDGWIEGSAVVAPTDRVDHDSSPIDQRQRVAAVAQTIAQPSHQLHSYRRSGEARGVCNSRRGYQDACARGHIDKRQRRARLRIPQSPSVETDGSRTGIPECNPLATGIRVGWSRIVHHLVDEDLAHRATGHFVSARHGCLGCSCSTSGRGCGYHSRSGDIDHAQDCTSWSGSPCRGSRSPGLRWPDRTRRAGWGSRAHHSRGAGRGHADRSCHSRGARGRDSPSAGWRGRQRDRAGHSRGTG